MVEFNNKKEKRRKLNFPNTGSTNCTQKVISNIMKS